MGQFRGTQALASSLPEEGGSSCPGRSLGGRVRAGQTVYLSEQKERATCKTTVNLKEVGGRS